MTYVPQYKCDIFVSYAHVDDQPLPGAEEGWVTLLIKALKIQLAKKLGRSDAYELWYDHNLSKHTGVTSQIMDTLRETAVIVIILSPGYLASEWCQREKDTFLDLVKDRKSSGSRMFVVEHDVVEESKRPEELKQLLGYRFWVQNREGKPPKILGLPKPDPTELDYYVLINDLSYDLAKELKSLRKIAEDNNKEENNKTGKVAGDSVTVFLAEVTDDLDPLRDNIKRYLDQYGIDILPKNLYPRDHSQFQEGVERDLSQCALFVQLLSDVVGKRPPGLTTSYSHLQHECAMGSGKPILQWRSRDLDIAEIADKEHRKLSGLDTVMAVGIEEFKSTIVEKAFYKPAASAKKKSRAFVFVDREINDQSIADNVCKFLDDLGAEYVLPMQSGKPVEIREDLEQNLLDCDGVIVIYGKIPVKWVREQLRQCRKILAKRERPLRALAVYEGPPAQKVPLDLKLQNMHIIDCREGLKDNKLKFFIESLGEG